MQPQANRLWEAPHRALFLSAGLWAVIAPSVWLFPAQQGADPVAWHRHELMFGMGGAAVGGYLLTALPHWTQARAVPPAVTRAAALLWLAARCSFFLGDRLPFAVLAAGTQAYLLLLLGILAQQIHAARLWRKAWLVVALAGLVAADLVDLSDLDGNGTPPLLSALLFAVMIMLIGGRAVPAFTRSGLAGAASPVPVHDGHALGLAGVAALVAAAVLAAGGCERAAGAGLMVAGGLQAVRMAGWHSLATRHYPALAILHLAWAWLVAGLLLLGLALLAPDRLPVATALHGLAAGAMGTTMLAIMARAAMIRRSGRLVLGRPLALSFALVWLSALVRVLAPFAAPPLPDPIRVAAAAWMVGWALFVSVHLHALRRPVPRPVLSARRSKDPGAPDGQA